MKIQANKLFCTNKSLLCILLLFVNFIAFGQEKSIRIPPGKPAVLELRAPGKLVVEFYVDDVYFSSHSTAKPALNRLYFTIDAPKTAKTIRFKFAFPIDVTDVSLTPVQLSSPEQFGLYESLFHASAQWQNEEWLSTISLLGSLLDDNVLPKKLREWVLIELPHMLLTQQNIAQAIELSALNNRFFDDHLLLQCQLVEYIIHASDLSQKKQKLDRALADLAYISITKQYQTGKLTEDSHSTHLTKRQYDQYCKVPIQKINELTPSIAPSASHGALFDDAYRYIMYVLSDEKNAPSIAKYHAQLAMWHYYFFTNQYRQSENIARLAISAIDNNNQHRELRNQFSLRLASVLHLSGQVGEALKQYRDLLSRTKGADDTFLRRSLLVFIGNFYRVLGEPELGKRYLVDALNLFEQEEGKISLGDSPCRLSNNGFRSSTVLKELAILSRELGDHEIAEHYLDCAIEIVGIGQHNIERSIKAEQAKQVFKQGKFSKSLALINDVLEQFDLIKIQKLNALIIKFEILLEMKSVDAHVSEVVDELAKELGYHDFYHQDNLQMDIPAHPTEQINTFELLIRLNKKTGKEQWTKLFMQKAVDIIKQYGFQVTNTQAWNTARFKLVEAYVNSQMLDKTEMGRAQVKMLYETLEQNYSINLLAEKNKFLADFTGDLDDLSQRYKHWLAAENAVLTKAMPSIAEMYQLDKARDAYLGYAHLSSQDERSLLPFIKIEQLQENMPEEDVLIRYFVSTSSSFLLFVTKEKAVLREIDDESKLFSLNAKIETLIHTNQARALQHLLSNHNLLPITDLLEARHKKIVIIPDYILHRIPFSALKIGASDGSNVMLGQAFELVMTFSASQYYGQASAAKSIDAVAIFADPLLNPVSQQTKFPESAYRNLLADKRSLPGTRREAMLIADVFPNHDITLGIGADANTDFLMSSHARNADILHIATHGFYHKDTPELVGLVTSAPSNNSRQAQGILSINELLSRPVNSRLVVVSGCDTMLGKRYKGAGLRSMSRGFLAQGAQTVVGTLWPVQDNATAEFMYHFYAALHKTGNSASALYHAKREFSLKGRYRHPKYWAGFVLTSIARGAETWHVDL